jgi:glycosyltransferase involved in cell wall biosynthesis
MGAEGFSPDVSVVMTCYNEQDFIAAAIASVFAQSAAHRIDRVIVVDDGSKDGSFALLERLAADEPRLIVRTQTNAGLSAARNAALSLVETPWVAILDGDDLWAKDHLAALLDAAERARPDVALIYGDFVDFVGDAPDLGVRIKVRRYDGAADVILPDYFVHDGPIIPSTTLMRTAKARAIGFFDPAVRLFEDTDFFLRLLEAGGAVQHAPGALIYKRRRGESLSANVAKWEGAMTAIGEACIARQPELARLRGRRHGFRLAKIAEAHFVAGKDREGWTLLKRALAKDPTNPRAWIYAAFAALPPGLRGGAKAWLRRRRSREVAAGQAG